MYGIPVYQVYPTKTWKEFEKHYGDLVDAGRLLVEKVGQLLGTISRHLCYLIW